MKYWAIALCVICIGGLNSPGFSQPKPKTEYVGNARTPMGIAWIGFGLLTFELATAEDLKRLPFSRNQGDIVFENGLHDNDRLTLDWYISKDKNVVKIRGIPLLLVETKDGNKILYGDLDGDGRFLPNDRFRFSPIFDVSGSATREPFERFGQMVGMDSETTLTFPLPGSFLKRYAVNIYSSSLYDKLRLQDNTHPNTRVLWYALYQVANGEVIVYGRKVLVQFSIDPRDGSMLPTAFRGIDCDGDGKINSEVGSTESAYIFDGDPTPIFHVGNHYLSVDRFDSRSGKIVLTEHPESEYERVELRLGAEFPDFNFIDLDGRKGSIAEFRGKYVLLDFWGTWCSGSRDDLPYFKEAYEKYRAQGFEILGVDAEESRDNLARFVAEKKIAWRQATAESTVQWVRNKVRIQDHGYPTHILLDPNGRILSVGRKGELPLDGEGLRGTLAKLLRPLP